MQHELKKIHNEAYNHAQIYKKKMHRFTRIKLRYHMVKWFPERTSYLEKNALIRFPS